ncbi:MAG TPA: hypothetical protein VJN95_18005 [Gemmatimonadales bacterium]|nr:hypothetical protein [Gemmatimonadales bacterium]
MTESLVRRLFAAALLSVPVSFWLAAIARRTLQEMAADPTAYIARKQALQHPTALGNYATSLVMLGMVVVAVEVLAFLLARLQLPWRSATGPT